VGEVIRAGGGFDPSLFKGSSCAFGVFDGVHRGHQFLMRCTQDSARASGGASIALTFDIDPDEKFHPGRLKKLMANPDRLDALAASGVDAVVALPFTDSFAALGPDEFLRETFGGFVPESLHVGSDFRFGARALGTAADLRRWGAENGTRIHAHDLQSSDGAPITSTRIRLLLGATDIEKANGLLGRPYHLKAEVVPGRGEGGTMGFRTANLRIDPLFQVLGDGVYAAYATVGPTRIKAAVSVGIPPTFAEDARSTCEAHILDYSGDLYGKTLKVEFTHFLRPMMHFPTKEELITTVLANIAWVREHL